MDLNFSSNAFRRVVEHLEWFPAARQALFWCAASVGSDGKPVGFIPDALEQVQALRMARQQDDSCRPGIE